MYFSTEENCMLLTLTLGNLTSKMNRISASRALGTPHAKPNRKPMRYIVLHAFFESLHRPLARGQGLVALVPWRG